MQAQITASGSPITCNRGDAPTLPDGPRPVGSRTVRAIGIFALGWLLVVVTACTPPPDPPEGWGQWYLTRDLADVVLVSEDVPGRVEVTAPSGTLFAGTRVLFHRVDAPASLDHQSCATVQHSGRIVQEGVALRMREDGDRRRGITVMKNIWAGSTWVYNVHVWDSTIPGDLPASLLASFDMGGVVAADLSAPRRLCARVVGAELTFKVWLADGAEPGWDDAVHTRRITLRNDYVFQGRPGLYAGHLQAGDWAVFTEHTTGVVGPSFGST